MTNEQRNQFNEGRQAGIDAQGNPNPPHSQWNAGKAKPAPAFEAGYWNGYLSGGGKWKAVAA